MSNDPEGQPGHLFSRPQCEKAHNHAWCVSHSAAKTSSFIVFISTVETAAFMFIVINISLSRKTKRLATILAKNTKYWGWVYLYSRSYVGSSWHRWPRSCTFRAGWVPAGAGWGRSAWGPGRSPYTPRRPGSPDRPAAQTTVIQCTGTITEPHTNDNTAFLYHSLGLILVAARRGRADADTRGAAKQEI